MSRLFLAETRLKAWLEAAQYLIDRGPSLSIILSVTSPWSDGVSGRTARTIVNQFYGSEREYPLHTVAETIFPGWEYRRRGLRGVYNTYEDEYQTLKSGEPQRWGTYAHRLIRRTTATGEITNPLDTLIRKMRSEAEQGKGPKRSCYEIGVGEGEYDLPLYNTIDDQGRRRGGPCLSHLSFKLYEGSVHLIAMYRSHDYRYKALGNLLGLARLQACVAHEVGVPIGSLVVHSTYAFLASGSKRRLVQLISDLRSLVHQEEQRELA